MSQEDLLATSADYDAMSPYWQQVDAITGGAEAMRKGNYMPRFPQESEASYDYRKASSVLIDVFSDIVEGLASKPFTREAGLADDNAPDAFKQLIEDIDTADNHLHIFAQDVFNAGISYGLDWIIADYPTLPEGATLADERAIGLRPYLVRVSCKDMLEVRSEVVAGREMITYARMNESDEKTDRVHIMRHDEGGAVWEKWERSDSEWVMVAGGAVSIGYIPLVPFYTGRRKAGTWQFTLPMKRVTDLQVEHYQACTSLKLAKELTAFPMLVGEGISPPVDENGNQVTLPVGPGSVLYAPQNDAGIFGTWKSLEPTANSLIFLSEELDKLESKMRELGRMPLAAGTAGMTQVAVAFSSQRASSAVQAWAYMLKDALENALRFCADWLGIDYEPVVYIDTDFAITIGDDKAPELIKELHADGYISLQTMLQELKRRGILSAEFDADKDALLAINDFNNESETLEN